MSENKKENNVNSKHFKTTETKKRFKNTKFIDYFYQNTNS